LNPSLTEAFGIGILEAACAGLFVVSTRVGGVPEVLPPGLVEFAEPDVEDLVRAVSRAVEHVRSGRHDPVAAHESLKEMYSWADVAERTEKVYYGAMGVEDVPVVERLRRSVANGHGGRLQEHEPKADSGSALALGTMGPDSSLARCCA